MLKNKLKQYKLILASGSKKATIFKDLELDFEIRLKEIEEIYPPELKAQKSQTILPS
jgi:septum formation protein